MSSWIQVRSLSKHFHQGLHLDKNNLESTKTPLPSVQSLRNVHTSMGQPGAHQAEDRHYFMVKALDSEEEQRTEVVGNRNAHTPVKITNKYNRGSLLGVADIR